MRFLELHAIAYGPFTNVTLDLSGGREGLHVVYGPNEAGKTSLKRALYGLLYGIPERTDDDFLHRKSDLKVGARLRRSDGQEIAFVRRKGRRGTLLSPDGRPLPDDALDPFLGGIPADLFQRMFGIGHEDLAQGSEALLHGGANVAESLFAAGLGTAEFRQILRRIEEEADDLFLPRGQKQLLNQAMAAFGEAKRRVREYALKEDVWRKAREEWTDAGSRVDALARQIAELQVRHGRLARWVRLAPVVGRLRAAREALEALRDVRRLAPDASQRRRDAEAELRAAREAIETAEAEIARLEQKIAAITIPPVWLDMADDVAGLKEAIGEYRKHGEDLPKRRTEKEDIVRDVVAILSLVRPDLDLSRAEEALPAASDIDRARTLITERVALDQVLSAASAAEHEARLEIQEAEDRMGSFPPAQDPSGLSRLLMRVRQDGEKALAEARRQVEALRLECETRAARLFGGQKDLDNLARQPVPDLVEVDEFDERLKQVRYDLDRVAKGLQQCEEESRKVREEIAAIENAGAVLLEADLMRERNRRDEGWALVRRAWQNGRDPGIVVETYHKDLPLAEAFEEAMKTADEVSDRLRREAQRVQQLAALKARASRLEEERASLMRQGEEATARLDEWGRAWTQRWAGVVPDPQEPRAMREWLARYREFCEAWSRYRQASGDADHLATLVAKDREDLASALASLGEEIRPEEGLTDLVVRATTLIETIRKLEQERARIRAEQDRAQRTLQRKADEVRSATEQLEKWTAEWTAVLERLGLDVHTPLNEVEDRIKHLARFGPLLKQLRDMERRIEGMERDRRQFEEEVSKQVTRLSTQGVAPPAGLDPIETVQWMDRQVSEARTLKERRDRLTDEVERRKAALARARERERSALKALAQLCQEAGCEDPASLPELERRSEEALRLEADVAALRQQIAQDTGGRPLDEVIREVEAVDPVEAEAEMRGVEEEMARLDAERTKAAEERGRLEEQLKNLEGSTPAIEAAQEAQSALARIREGVRRYVPLRLASVLLRRAIDDYRARHQDPLLTRAGEIFRDITLQEFSGVGTDFGEDDRLVLVGIRKTGRPVHVAHMSDGTRDQLYLALRLATIEDLVKRNEPMPLVLDDVLIRFDDYRAKASLRALAEVSNQTQVILFTHHRRIVELAREAVPDQVLSVRELRAG